MPDAPPPAAPIGLDGRARLLTTLVLAQIGLHSAMAGLRMAAPLQALSEGYSALAAGLLMALFAALPVLTAMRSGRMTDRHGYHRPVYVAVALTLAGMSVAVAAALGPADWRLALLCVAAATTGVGANMGLIAIQRSAGQLATDSTSRMRVFSWLGMAPSIANMVGPVTAGFAIDAGGYATAYALLLLGPLLTLVCARRVPRDALPPHPDAATRAQRTAWDLLQLPGFRRLLMVNFLLSTCWDVHTFAVPVLGHERGFSASTIGLVLGVFTAAVTGVRVVIPIIAHRLSEKQVLQVAMVLAGAIFAVYPLATTPWLMAGCAALLGLALGSVQPMVMSTLHHLTPAHRHGEAIALRSATINAASSLMPLAMGAAGALVGAAAIFWVMAAAVAGGSRAVRGLPAMSPPGSAAAP